MVKVAIKPLSQPVPDAQIAACGLFCTNCGAFKKGRCEGCQIAPRFKSCKIRACCADKGIIGCWECDEFKERDFADCKKINNFMAKVFAVLFKSDRPGALLMLRDQGIEKYLEVKRASGKQ